MLVDKRRRAERRKLHYDRILQDPNQFLQVHGRKVKIHLDPAIAQAGDNPKNMMPWPGDSKVIIDRYAILSSLLLLNYILACQNRSTVIKPRKLATP